MSIYGKYTNNSTSSDTSMVKDIFKEYYEHYIYEKTRASKNLNEVAKKVGMKIDCRSTLEVEPIPTEKATKDYVDKPEDLLYFDPKDLDI